MASLTDTVTWVAYGSRLLALIDDSPTGDHLLLLQDYLGMATEIGDKRIPPARWIATPDKNAIHGCLLYAKALWDWSSRPDGVKSVKTGQLAESYADPGTEAARAAALAAAWPFWSIYVKDKTKLGALKR